MCSGLLAHKSGATKHKHSLATCETFSYTVSAKEGTVLRHIIPKQEILRV